MSHQLAPLLEPRSIAIVGASNDPKRIGGMGLDLLRHFDFKGPVYPINPKYQEVFGYRCYPDIESLPETPDLVVLALGAADVTAMLKRCAARSVPAAIVYAAGFAEAGDSGSQLQAELKTFVDESGMIVAGPNCMGFANLNLNAHTAFASVFRSVPPQQENGKVSVITQSGNVCSAVFSLIRRRGVPVSHFINTGNEASLEFSEYLEFLAQDEYTRCVVGYVEELRNGQRFIDAALEFSAQGKPLVLYKAGETERGAEAVRSHTSALAGELALYKAAFDQLNVIRATDFAQMADLAYLAGYTGRTAGRRVGIVSMSGALGAILADKMIGAGLDVPVFTLGLQETLRAGIPDYGMVSNPVDVTGNIVNSPDFVRAVFEALAATDEIDVVVVYATGYLLDRMADAMIEVCARYPRLFVAIDTGAATSREKLASAGIPVFDDIGRFSQAVPPLCLWQQRQPGVQRWSAMRQKPADATRAMEVVDGNRNEYETKLLLKPYGVVGVQEEAVKDADEAVQAAHRIGYPVVLKVLSRDIAHKTEVGGVKLNIAGDEALRSACARMLDSVRASAPDAVLDGFLIQQMSSDGVTELIVGAVRDPVFGPSITVGFGGVLTELYRDASHRLLPIDRQIALEMLQELKAWPLLDGFRGKPKADVNAAADAICAVSAAFLALGDSVAEVEINPLVVKSAGQGAVALDALIIPNRI